jgi:hypothetical protein
MAILAPLSRIRWLQMLGLTSRSSISVACISVLMPVQCCFCYYGSVVCLKLGVLIAPALLFLFRIALAIQGLLHFHKIFRIIFFYFCEECQWNFGGYCIESIYHFS